MLPAEPAGESALPPALSPPRGFTRRGFLAVAGGALVAGAFAGCGGSGGGKGDGGGPVEIFKLAAGGRRVSNAAKKHNANMRFLTATTADQNRAHAGDRSLVVTLPVSLTEYHRLFGRGNGVADLRHL